MSALVEAVGRLRLLFPLRHVYSAQALRTLWRVGYSKPDVVDTVLGPRESSRHGTL